MNLEEQLKTEILSKYKSIRAFTTDINIPYSMLDSVFRRGLVNAGISTMLKVFDALDLDIESVSTGQLSHREKCFDSAKIQSEHSKEWKEMSEYRKQLNNEGRERLLLYASDLVATGRYQSEDYAVKLA